ncbi:uncharacterized protein LOC100142249 isoform X1 [Tribolium castaneum]|uniref:uncharacterized protein LOC100142249 isoform X1 n=1 Tax=Tribolium castaneum TaxID=7070 RepID=UPI0030FE80E3
MELDEHYSVRDHLTTFFFDLGHLDLQLPTDMSSLSVEAQAVLVLSRYFGIKTSDGLKSWSLPNDFTDEITYIKTIFPSLDADYVRDQLKVFRDMPNRLEIVLRIIVNTKVLEQNKESPLRKRSSFCVQITDDQIKQHKPSKIRKVSATVTNQIPNETSTSMTNICIVSQNYNKKPCTITSSVTSVSDETTFENDIKPLSEPDDYLRIVLNMEQDARKSKSAVNSQDSDKTEIYVPDIKEEECKVLEPTKCDSPLNLKVDKCDVEPNETSAIKVEPVQEEIPNQLNENERLLLELHNGLEIPSFDDKGVEQEVEVTPSTSTGQTNVLMNLDGEYFDLVKHVHKATKAPPAVIKYHCTKLRLCRYKRPPNQLLERLIINVLSNTIDLDTSDDGESSSQDTSFSDWLKQQQQESENLIPQNEPENVSVQLVNHLCSIFPDACPRYIRGLCGNKEMNDMVLDELITIILSANNEYPKRSLPAPEPEVIPENQFEILQEVLPDADPDYLRMMCDKFEGNPEAVKTFINNAMEKHDYPKLKDYQRKQQISAQQKQYTTEFDVKNFVKVIPNPEDFFTEKSRVLKLDPMESHYALVFLKNTFTKLPVRSIQHVFQANSTKNNSNLLKTFNQLEQMQKFGIDVMRSVRKAVPMPNNITNIPLLQEIAYLAHKREITEYVNEIKKRETVEREEVKSLGLMQTCNCCYDEEVLPREIYTCQNNCEFCKSCIVKSVEVAFGEGKLDFPCLASCESSFSLQTLQAVLSPKLFSKIAQKKALEEIKSAGIEDLEVCPFCDFATIPAEGYTIFTCLNPECMKESCRMCKEPSHIPLRCDEIEKDADVKARTFVENKMTEALLRKCWKCGVKFFKEEGCNKMTCSCGASMCYICGQPVTDYKHFNGNGGDRYDLCPLYSDTHDLNKDNVLKGAAQAKAELGNVMLKHDPTKDVQEYYNQRKKKHPLDHLFVMVPGRQGHHYAHRHHPHHL